MSNVLQTIAVKDLSPAQLLHVCEGFDLDTSGTSRQLVQRLNTYCEEHTVRKDDKMKNYLINKAKLTGMITEQKNSEIITATEDQPINNDNEEITEHQTRSSSNVTRIANSPASTPTITDEERSDHVEIQSRKTNFSSGNSRKIHFGTNSSTPLLTEIRKQACDIKAVAQRSPAAFETLIAEIEKFGDLYGWSESTKNRVVMIKIEAEWLNEINFNVFQAWEETTEQIRNRFGLSFRRLQNKLDNFRRTNGETLTDALRRLLKLLNISNLGFQNLTKEYKLQTLRSHLRKIFQDQWITFQLRWAQENNTVNFNRLLDLSEEVEEMMPVATIPDQFVNNIDDTDLDEIDGECYAIQSFGNCHFCRKPGHYINKCPARKAKADEKNKEFEDLKTKVLSLDERLTKNETQIKQLSTTTENGFLRMEELFADMKKTKEPNHQPRNNNSRR